jgi:hypothetical protein
MPNDNSLKRTFLNRRDWAGYLRGLPITAPYPKLIEVVKSGRDWFTESASHASHWLTGTDELGDEVTLG